MDRSLFTGLSALLAGVGLIGSLATIHQSLAAYKAEGVQEVRLHFLDGVQPASIRRFAQEFIA